ncbi:MAG TPA: HDOD domain-containing protein [Bryobacteraceae bacterium]|jgi:putative nucleotidyltransferase with HDIG domain|nr:HDOD domain-containing protein [Bryobacteraceae bacterium]
MDTAVTTLAGLKNLPAFPPAAAKAMNLLASENVVYIEVAKTIQTDAALSAEVLRLANSALFAARNRINTIPQALSFIGTRRLTGLLFTLCMSKLLKRIGARESIRRCWYHNLACALAAKEFAKSFGRDVDEGYNAGLFHDIGRLALIMLEPARYDELIAQEGALLELERAHFGIDHCEAGAWLIEQWKLPLAFVEVAMNHHSPKSEGSEVTMRVNGACAVADRLGFSIRRAPTDAAVDPNDELGLYITETIQALASEYGI